MDVLRDETDLVFLYRLVDGNIGCSYAAYSALAAGLQEKVVERGFNIYMCLKTGKPIEKLNSERKKVAREFKRLGGLVKEFLRWNLKEEGVAFLEYAETKMERWKRSTSAGVERSLEAKREDGEAATGDSNSIRDGSQKSSASESNKYLMVRNSAFKRSAERLADSEKLRTSQNKSTKCCADSEKPDQERLAESSGSQKLPRKDTTPASNCNSSEKSTQKDSAANLESQKSTQKDPAVNSESKIKLLSHKDSMAKLESQKSTQKDSAANLESQKSTQKDSAANSESEIKSSPHKDSTANLESQKSTQKDSVASNLC